MNIQFVSVKVETIFVLVWNININYKLKIVFHSYDSLTVTSVLWIYWWTPNLFEKYHYRKMQWLRIVQIWCIISSHHAGVSVLIDTKRRRNCCDSSLVDGHIITCMTGVPYQCCTHLINVCLKFNNKYSLFLKIVCSQYLNVQQTILIISVNI